MMSDKDYYQIISSELATKNMDAATWTQAIAVAEGEPAKTQAAYIRLRLADLKKSASSQAITSLETSKPQAESLLQGGGVSGIRSELTKKLQALGKTSLYSTLSLHPDASDAVVARAIEDYEARAKSGSVAISAEFKYAKETLGDPKSREQYDRKLLGSLSGGGAVTQRSYNYQPIESEYSWWESRKTSIIIGVLSLALLGYLGFGSYNERKKNENQKAAIEMQREVVHAASDIEQQKLNAQEALQNQMMENQRRAMEQAQTQQLLQQSSYQDMQAERQRIQQEQMDKIKAQQQQQAENLQQQKDQRYWSCINQQLSNPRTTTADAYARCGYLH